MNSEILYEHQEYINNKYHNKFLYVHDDTFARTFESKEEIEKYFNEVEETIEIEVISKIKTGINVFLLTIISDKALNSESCLEKLSCYHYIGATDVRYYTIIPCNFKGVI